MLTSIENGIHFVENAAQIPSYIPAVSTVTGAARAVSSLTLAVASLACAFFHQVNALHASVTSQMEKKLEQIEQRNLAFNLLGRTIIGVCRGALEALPIIGNLAAYAIDSYATQKEMAARINNLLENYLDVQYQLEGRARELITAQERNRELSGQIDNLQKVDERKAEEIARLSRQVETLANQKKQAEEVNETLRLAKANAEDEVRRANLNYSAESQKVQGLTLELQKVRVLEQKLNALASDKLDVEKQKETLSQEIEELTQQVAHLQDVKNRNEETIKAYRIETKNYQNILKKQQLGLTSK